MQFRTFSVEKDFPNTNHYWAEKFFFALKETRYQFWNGQYAELDVVLGKKAFRAGPDYNVDNDIY